MKIVKCEMGYISNACDDDLNGVMTCIRNFTVLPDASAKFGRTIETQHCTTLRHRREPDSVGGTRGGVNTAISSFMGRLPREVPPGPNGEFSSLNLADRVG